MKKEQRSKTENNIHNIYCQLSLIRDRDDCPEKITDMIDEIRFDDFFEECHGME